MSVPIVAIAGIFAGFMSSSANDPAILVAPAPVSVPHAPSEGHTQSLALTKMVATIPVGSPWAIYLSGRRAYRQRCEDPPDGASPLLWRGNAKSFAAAVVRPIVADEVKQAGLLSADDPSNLFDTDHHSDLQIAGNLKAINGAFCLASHLKPPANNAREKLVYDVQNSSGVLVLTIEWQIYSNSERKVVLTTTTSTGVDYETKGAGMFDRLIDGSIRENVRALLANADLQKIVLTAPSEPTPAAVTAKAALPLLGSLSAKPVKISDAIGAVVLIESGGGHGSGVLVSSDGYVLTDQHVVDGEKYVKIRWSDGLEGLGEVIRSDKRRDVALVKTNPRGRLPLAIRTQTPQPGDTVFAIGAPEEIKLQNTVTRGVVSASNRIVDGFSFIQSDVTVNPGNSGGPLLDEKGEVLGLTDWKLESRDGATGLNFFTPIGDALAFLSLQPQ